MSILGEFKAFISKGNVMDLAVGVIIGGAFQGIVASLVKDVITPVIALFCSTVFHSKGPPAFASWAYGGIMVGSFLNNVVSFITRNKRKCSIDSLKIRRKGHKSVCERDISQSAGIYWRFWRLM